MPKRGDVIGGRYRLVEPLASGGMGTVWRARHVELDADVALKMMSPAVAAAASGKKRFRREAQAAAQLKSPHIVQVHDFGIFEDQPYLAMELLEGEDLDQRLSREGALAPELCAEILDGVAKAVQLAHDHGIVHRDLKPANIFLAAHADGFTPKVLDFGIAKDVSGGESSASTTGAGVVGSPAYMSPEQVWGEGIDHRTDIWAMGVVALEMLLGDNPFADDKLPRVFDRIIRDELPKPSALRDDLAPFDAFFERALARDPAARLSSASAFAAEFRGAVRAARGEAPQSQREPAGSAATTAPAPRREAPPSGRVAGAIDASADTVEITQSTPAPQESAAVTPRRGGTLVAALAGAVIVAGVVVVAGGGTQSTQREDPGSPPPASAPAAIASDTSTTSASSSTKAPPPAGATGEGGHGGSTAVTVTTVAPSTNAPAPSGAAASKPPPPPRAAPPPPPARSSSSPTATGAPVDPVFGIPVKSP